MLTLFDQYRAKDRPQITFAALLYYVNRINNQFFSLLFSVLKQTSLFIAQFSNININRCNRFVT